MRKHYKPDFTRSNKLIVGEGESDLQFFQELCVKNVIEGFEFAFTGMHEVKPSGEYGEAGFEAFGKYLKAFGKTSDLPKVTDIVLVCDSGNIVPANPHQRFLKLRRMITEATHSEPAIPFRSPDNPNQPDDGARPRVHILILPWFDEEGGIETLCLRAAEQAAGVDGQRVIECVKAFANCVDTSNLTKEKQDKFLLQSFLSGSWKRRPEVRVEQIWNTHRSVLIPLDSNVFMRVREFLQAVARL